MGEQFGTPYTVAGPGRAPRTGTAGDTWYRRTEPRPSSSAGARFTQEEGGKKRRETARPLRITPQDQPARERIRPTAQRGQPQDLPVSGPALRSPPSTGLSFFFIIFRVRRPAVSFILFIFLLFLCLAPARLLSPSCYTIQALGEAAVIAGFSALSLSGEASPVLGLNDQPAPLHDKTIFL